MSYHLVELVITGFVLSLLFMTVMWILSVRLSDVSIVDRVWGVNFVLLSCAYVISAENFTARSLFVLVLITVWGLRLSWHIHSRNRQHGEDLRYVKMREKNGTKFWISSLWRVFWLQGAIAVIVSLPVAAVAHSEKILFPTIFDYIGFTLWLVGFVFEAGGDYQLKKFKERFENRGKLLSTGFWGLTRHPNYFGDAFVWWGIFSIACALNGSLWTVIGPLIMTLLLRAVSGVTLLESELAKNKPGYSQYMATVPAFLPRFGFGNLFRFFILASLKILAQIFYRFDVAHVGPMPKPVWNKARVAVLLNHTSLMEPLFAGVVPFRYLWRLATKGIFPIADVTYNRPIVGRLFRFFAPKVVMLSRRRDKTWDHFLSIVDERDTMVFLPEGRMKRPNGLDKDGRPMTVRGGLVDIMLAMQQGTLIFCYSQGLHHIFAPGDRYPKILRSAGIKFESIDIADYMKQFAAAQDLRLAVMSDLEERRDRFCATD